MLNLFFKMYIKLASHGYSTFRSRRLLWHVTNYELEKQVSENLFDFQLPSVPFFKTKITSKTCFAL